MNFYKRAKEYYETKDYPNAITYYEKCVSWCYDDSKDDKYDLPTSLFNIGTCYIKLKNYITAMDYFTEALFYREDFKYYYNIGFCYFEMNLKAQALEAFTIANSINDEDEDTINALHTTNTEINKALMNLKQEVLVSDEDKAEVLKFIINYDLDTGNKKEFEDNTKQLKIFDNKISSKILHNIVSEYKETPRNLYGEDI